MISTPNLSLKRKIGEQFKVYSIDEFKTSCLSSKTMERTDNMYLSDPKNKQTIRKMHSILTYKMGNKRTGCINRDNNAVSNMINITKQFLKDRSRPEQFMRSVKIDDIKSRSKKTIKESNPKLYL
jgi:hypothetical protein